MPYVASPNLSRMSQLPLVRSLAFAAGLSAVGCSAYPMGPRMPTASDPGTTDTRYNHASLESRFTEIIRQDYHLPEAEVGVIDSFITDLDNGGVSNDVAGTAILKRGGYFSSFIFLMRDDGSVRFLEDTGASFQPASDGSTLACYSKPSACPATMERARGQIRGARFSVIEADTSQAGLEIVIPYGNGDRRIINSLRLFNAP